MALPSSIKDSLQLNSAGLIPVVVQDATSLQVLMVAWMNEEALEATLTTRKGTYWSRSRQQLWVKGETSGHTQQVREVKLDCDGDTLLMLVDQTGPACHKNTTSCFDAQTLLADSSDTEFKMAK